MAERRDEGDEQQEWDGIIGGPVIDASGRIERPEPPGASEPAPAPAPPVRTEDPPLELARELRRDEAAPAAFVEGLEPAPPPRRRGALVAIVLLVLLGAGALFFGGPLGRAMRGAVPASLRGETPFVLIDSEPSGASIRLGDRVVGTTPWSAGNVWPEGPVPFELRLDGYVPHRGSFEGAQEQIVDVPLKKRGR